MEIATLTSTQVLEYGCFEMYVIVLLGQHLLQCSDTQMDQVVAGPECPRLPASPDAISRGPSL